MRHGAHAADRGRRGPRSAPGRLTPDHGRLQGSPDSLSPQGLGQTPAADVRVHGDELVPGDLYLLSATGVEHAPLRRALDGFATRPFPDALVAAFQDLARELMTALIIGRWVG